VLSVDGKQFLELDSLLEPKSLPAEDQKAISAWADRHGTRQSKS